MEKGKSTDAWIPKILRIGRRGVRAKIWTFLFVNRPNWFTAQEIAGYLGMPLSTVQVAIKDVCALSPRIDNEDIKKLGKGRPEKRYRFT